MARQGRFGRPTQGTQNLSSLIYMLLKEERTDQENTMLRAYSNNMQGGTMRNTFSSGGSTNAATAGSVYAWYVSQANLAKAQGDNAGYTSLLQKAEDFRLQSLRDQETILNNAYQNGTSIDKALFGASGIGTLSVGDYEALLGYIAQQPGMTEADISRINRTIFGASYESTAADMVRQYNEKKVQAKTLVEFYDKELLRADGVGVPRDSQRYQQILDARSRAVAAQKADLAQSRYDYTAKQIKDEKKKYAIALQKFISPILDTMFTSKSTVNSLKAKITDDGQDFLNTITGIVNSSAPGKFTDILTAAGTANGVDQASMEALLGKAEAFSAEVTRLKELGYGKELGSLVDVSNFHNDSVSSGTWNVVTKSASTRLATTVASSGGVLSSPLSSDPYATAKAYDEYIKDMGNVASADRYDDILTADDVAAIGQDDLSGIFTGAKNPTIAGVVDQVVSETGIDFEDSMLALVDLLGNPNAWNAPDLNMVKVKESLKRMGVTENSLTQMVSSGGEMTIGTVLRLAVEKDMLRRVDEDPNLVWGYSRSARGYFYHPISVAQAKNGSYAMTSATGGNNNLVFVEKVELSTQDSTGRVIGNSGISYVAVPGGGDLSTGQMDANDYIEVESGNQVLRLTRQDLDDYSTYAASTGGDFTTPIVDQQTGNLKIGAGFVEQLKDTSPRSTFRTWLDITAAEKGDAWYNSKFVGTGLEGTQGKATALVSTYASTIQKRIGVNIPEQDRAGVIDEAINTYFKETGIVDKTGRIKDAIVASLVIPNGTAVYAPEYLPGAGGTSPYPASGTAPVAPISAPPPPPAYVSPYVLQQTGGGYSVETAGPRPIGIGGDASSFFFRKAPGSGGVAPVPIITPTPMPEDPIIPKPNTNPTAVPKVTPLSGTPASGIRGIGRIAL